MYDDQDFEQEHSLLDKAAPVAGALVILLLVAIGGYWVHDAMTGEGMPPPPEVQEISLVKPPPPPPPPPPEQETPPEPEVEEEEVDVPEPEEQVKDMPEEISDEPPPGTELGLDAEGGAGGDAFGLIGRKGGRGLLGGAGGFGWYAKVVQEEIQTRLSSVDDVRKAEYTVVVKLWLTQDGAVESTVLEEGTGDPELDLALRDALGNGFRLSEAPPGDMPQPIRLRIKSRT